MRRIEVVLKERFKLSVRKKYRGKIVSELMVPEFGIIIHDSITPIPAQAASLYHLIEIDSDRLDDQTYIGSLNTEIFWKLVEAGYVRKIRIENKTLHKAIIINSGWGLNIINHRLKRLGNAPKNSYLVNLNEDFKANLEIAYMNNPEFFDFL